MTAVPNVIARRPLTPEHDLAGVVVDANDSEFSVGDEVIGFIPICDYSYYMLPCTYHDPFCCAALQSKTKQGALTEYTKLPAANIALKPSNVSAVEACGLPLVGETAMQALVDIGKLEAGQSVFINGGSSTVGMSAIYIAKALGAKVVTSASSRNEELCRKLGADDVSSYFHVISLLMSQQFVDYTVRPLHEHFMENPPSPKFDIIFDAVALVDPALYKHSNAYVKPTGLFISTGPWPDLKSWGGPTGVSNILSLGYEILKPSFFCGVNVKWTSVYSAAKPLRVVDV